MVILASDYVIVEFVLLVLLLGYGLRLSVPMTPPFFVVRSLQANARRKEDQNFISLLSGNRDLLLEGYLSLNIAFFIFLGERIRANYPKYLLARYNLVQHKDHISILTNAKQWGSRMLVVRLEAETSEIQLNGKSKHQ